MEKKLFMFGRVVVVFLVVVFGVVLLLLFQIVSQSTLLWSAATCWDDVVRGPAGEARQSWLAPLRPGQEQQLLRG